MPNEAAYQAKLIDKIQKRFPGSVVMKQDPREIQGIPDLLVLFGPYWAMLEVKISASSPYEPNQEWYLDLFGQMSFATTIFPENEEQVLHELQLAFSS